MPKHKRFDNSDSKERATRVYTHLQIDESDDEEQDLDEYEGDVDGYVSHPPAPLTPPS